MNSQEDYIKALVSVISVVFTVYAFFRQRRVDKQADAASEKIAQAESRVAEQPEKTKPAWDLARATLEAYFNRNLSQITSIFWLSVVVMVVGFAIIVWGASQAIQQPSVVFPASIATFAGLITEFVGATFLFIYRSTIQQAIDYSRTLERINSVGMAMQILDTIPEGVKGDDLKSVTKARLVEQLLAQANELPGKGQETLARQPVRRARKATVTEQQDS